MQFFKPFLIGMVLTVGAYAPSVNDKMVSVANTYVGIKETHGANRHPEIDRWNRRLNIPLGSSYCAAFVSFVLDSVGASTPKVRSGVAQHFITQQSISANRVMAGESIPAGSLVVWKRGDTWMGHIGIVREDWRGASGRTIEANTSSGNQGSQSDGDGIYRRTRTITPTAYFRITHFTLVK